MHSTGSDFAFRNKHAPAFENSRVLPAVLGEVPDIGGKQVVPDDIGGPGKPVFRYLRKDPALFGDRVREHHVKRRDTVRRNDQEAVTQVVDVADLSASRPIQAAEAGLKYDRCFHHPLLPVVLRVFKDPECGRCGFFLSRSTVNIRFSYSDLVSLRRKTAEKAEDEAADGLELIFRKGKLQFLVQVADIGLSLDDIAVRRDLVDLRSSFSCSSRMSDDLFNKVFQVTRPSMPPYSSPTSAR